MFIGFNVAFQPMMISGLLGMPRRISTYSDGLGWEVWNMMSTVGAFLIAASVLVFMYNVVRSLRSKELAGADPWDGRTLEWAIPSPPPVYNFAEIPQVKSLDDFWHTKYVENEQGQPVPVVAGAAEQAEEAEADAHHSIHMPSPSYFPIIAASGFPFMAFGFIYDFALIPVGAAVMLVGLYGWALEPATE